MAKWGGSLFKHALPRYKISFQNHKEKSGSKIQKGVITTAKKCVNRPLGPPEHIGLAPGLCIVIHY